METLRIIAAEVRHEDETYAFRKGPIPSDTPKAVVDALREQGALESSDTVSQEAATLDAFEQHPPRPDPTAIATGGAEGEPAQGAPDAAEGAGPGEGADSGSGSTSELPDGAPDAATADVPALASYIDSENLNASQTVALAKGDPELASKVLEAEQLASGGDGRKTVVAPLEKLAASGSGD